MQQHLKQQQQLRLQQQQKQNGGFVNGGFAGNQPQTAAQYPSAGNNSSNFTQSSPTPGSTNQQDMGVSDMELQAILSQTDITTTAENLLKQFGSSSEDLPGGVIKEEVISGGGDVVVEGSNTVAGSGSSEERQGEKLKITNKIKLENGTLKSTTTLKREKSKSPNVKVEKVQTVKEEDAEVKFTIDMDAKRINELCK